MRVLSVNVAAVGELFIPEADDVARVRRIATGIHKQPVQGAVAVGKLGLAGDEQADLTVHGGLDKAVYAYPIEHYPFWMEQRRLVFKRDEPLPPGSMGENLTLEGLLEREVWVGDRLHIGTAVLEVTQPRQPCYKFNAKMGFAHAVKTMLQSGYSGFYLRVIQTGEIGAGDAVTLHPGAREVSIAQLNERRRMGRQRDLF